MVGASTDKPPGDQAISLGWAGFIAAEYGVAILGNTIIEPVAYWAWQGKRSPGRGPWAPELPKDAGESLEPSVGAAILNQKIRLEVDVVETIMAEKSTPESGLRLGEAKAFRAIAFGDEPGKPIA